MRSARSVTTSDVFTAANGITLAGAILTLIGAIKLNTVFGLTCVIVGRAFDVLDGPVARRTHSSHFGAMFDATSDKLVGLALLIAAYHFRLAPVIFLLLVFVHHLIITTLSFLTEKRGQATQAGKAGKYTMFLHLSAISLFVWSHFSTRYTQSLRDVALAAAVISILFAIQNIRYCWRLLPHSHK